MGIASRTSATARPALRKRSAQKKKEVAVVKHLVTPVFPERTDTKELSKPLGGEVLLLTSEGVEGRGGVQGEKSMGGEGRVTLYLLLET